MNIETAKTKKCPMAYNIEQYDFELCIADDCACWVWGIDALPHDNALVPPPYKQSTTHGHCGLIRGGS